MMKTTKTKLLVVLVTAFLISNLAQAFVQPILKNISSKNLQKDLSEFVNVSLPSRFPGKAGHVKAQNWIQEKLKSFVGSKGIVRVQNFTPDIKVAKKMYMDDLEDKLHGTILAAESKKFTKFTNDMVSILEKHKKENGKNIIWSTAKKGSLRRKLVIMAHYDTVSFDFKTYQIKWNEKMPGADYNASGVIAALYLAKVFATARIVLDFDLEIVFTDYHALGFLGSEDYFKRLKETQNEIIGVINLEMLGYDSSYFDKRNQKGNMRAYMRSGNTDKKGIDKKFYNNINKAVKAVNEVVFTARRNDFQSSDNVIAWKYGYPCVTYSQNWEDDFNKKGYQTTNDFPETLNFETLYHSIRYLSHGIETLK